MSFKSFLSAVGHDFVSVFHYLGSPSGQAIVTGAEAVVNATVGAVNPAILAGLTGVETLINNGLKQALNMEAAAAAVGAQSGTGPQKSAAVIASLAPQVGIFLQSVGVSNPTSTQVETLSTALANGLVTILNSIPAPTAA